MVTAGADQRTDNFHGPVLLVVLHNDGLKFKQGKISHAPTAGEWFIFNDRIELSSRSPMRRTCGGTLVHRLHRISLDGTRADRARPTDEDAGHAPISACLVQFLSNPDSSS